MTLITNVALPFYSSVQFYGAQLPLLGPNTLQITQQEFAHDVAVATFWADDVGADSYASGMPVKIAWGRPSVQRAFYGYVNHPQRMNNALLGTDLMGRNSTTIVCMGASWPMKQSGTYTYQGMTASQVVAKICSAFGFALDIVYDETVWPVLHMAGMSFWSFCVMLAKRIGYTFYVSGMTAVFKPRQTDPTQINGLVAYYDFRQDPGGLPIFTPTLGATNPSGGELANRTLYGIDPRTTQVVMATELGNPAPVTLGQFPDTPVFNRVEHDTVRTQAEATTKLRGTALENQLYITASAYAAGDPLVAQGSLVFVTNANGSQNGLWFVTKCVQTVTTTSYSMDMELGRDSLGSTTSIRGIPQTTISPSVVLTNGGWKLAA